MKELLGAVLGNALFLLVILGVPLLALVFLPYEYGMPVILIWIGGLVLLWLISVLRAMFSRGKADSQDRDAP